MKIFLRKIIITIVIIIFTFAVHYPESSALLCSHHQFYEKEYDDDVGKTFEYCFDCPWGSYGSIAGMHQNTSCNWCIAAYYLSGYECRRCPTGSYGCAADYIHDDDCIHQNTTCEHCHSNHYSTGHGVCIQCPEEGITGGLSEAFDLYSKEDCFLPIGSEFTDNTGAYELTSSCYWSE